MLILGIKGLPQLINMYIHKVDKTQSCQLMLSACINYVYERLRKEKSQMAKPTFF